MPWTQPAPGYHRANVLQGWPLPLRTAAMLTVAAPMQIRRFWQNVQRQVILEALVSDYANLQPLGSFYIRAKTRAQYRNPQTRLLIPAKRHHVFRMAPSDYFQVALAGRGAAGAWAWPAWLDTAAIDAGITPLQARLLWGQMAATIIRMVSRGDDFRARGFGRFYARYRKGRAYRLPGETALRYAPPVAYPAFRASPTALRWIDAGGIPEIL